ncbi:MAG: inositol-3-phosphate synthase [Planctomycetota bacterium]
MAKTGVWIIGLQGSVATCVQVGAHAVRRGLVPPTGLLTEELVAAGIPVPALSDLVFGGCDIRASNPWANAVEFNRKNRTFTPEILDSVRSDLKLDPEDAVAGSAANCGAVIRGMADRKLPAEASAANAIARIQGELRGFQKRHDLETVVVVNLASTEPYRELPAAANSLPALRKLIGRRGKCPLPASVLYAWAALDAGFPFINFTPSPGSSLPALEALAIARKVPHMGKDGKTGETLMKTVLAPMFVARRFKVLSWEGYNMLGNRDGEVLNDPASHEAKARDKDDVLKGVLNDPDTHTRVRIDYVPSLDDWKTAWDFIHYRGFLDVPMSVQFIWQGCDSILAAPLVLDLVRFATLARRRGESGAMTHLACYFKKPFGTDVHDFFKQYGMLEGYCAKLKTTAGAGSRRK